MLAPSEISIAILPLLAFGAALFQLTSPIS